ncbi:hypothetical protein ACQP2E_27930 [Actinoplanes sp. CA-015351]
MRTVAGGEAVVSPRITGRVLAKLGARDRVQAVIWTHTHGLV